ncbi:MAG: nickel-dependent hydrogenase large subunit [Candidatus Omnitrophica bacterium]|nr:nickel-dependent hydrogenase large subunit [Candidatus Omnitrophota bacterium]
MAEKRRTIIPIGPYHPLQEEPEFYKLFVEGERIVDIDVRIGYNHRGIEKLAESKHYDQIVYLIERICGICSTSHPIAYVQAVEDIMGDIEIPERALYIRSIIGELERVHSHLLWLGLAGHFLGYNTVFMWAWKYREPVLDIFEVISGNRNHYAMLKPGGVRRDIDDDAIPGIIKILDDLIPVLDMFKGAVLDDPVLAARLKGVGILSKKDIVEYSALGPVARASGIEIDVRKDEPYAAYDRVKWNVITQQEGDVFAKAVVRILETYESISIIKQCLQKMPKGPIDAELKDIPPGEGIGHHEAPRGETFHYVRSDGTNSPVRHKVRAPTFMNFPTFKASVIGERVADATIILAAIDPCYCCTERMSVIDRKSGKQLLAGEQLIKLSQERTKEIARKMGRS